jgi:hypothetical protein
MKPAVHKDSGFSFPEIVLRRIPPQWKTTHRKKVHDKAQIITINDMMVITAPVVNYLGSSVFTVQKPASKHKFR